MTERGRIFITGALELAYALWKRSRAPLRAALLAQYVCEHLGEKGEKVTIRLLRDYYVITA